MSDDYDVGYGKPPKNTQFNPGQSGNPRGRPNKTQNFRTDLREELEAQVNVSEGGQVQTISRQRALIKRTIEKALKGDLRAAQMLVQWAGVYLADDQEALAQQPLTAEDLALLDRHGVTRAPDAIGNDEDIDGGETTHE